MQQAEAYRNYRRGDSPRLLIVGTKMGSILLFSMCSDITLFLVRFKTGLAYLPYIRAVLPLTGIVMLVLFVVAATVSTKPNGSMTRKSTTT